MKPTKAMIRDAARERVRYYTSIILVDDKARVLKRGQIWLVDAQIRIDNSEVVS